MKKFLCLILILLLFSGCGTATYEKRVQLSPQKTGGWEKSSPHTFQYECNQGEVKVGPIVLGYKSAGDVSLLIPIPASQKEVRKMNEADAWVYVEFRDTNPIESCDLSYVSLVNQGSGKRLTPTNSMDIPSNGQYKGKYTHACHYYFDVDKNSKGDYLLYISEEVFDCRIRPIQLKHEESTEFHTRELM